MRKQEQLYDRYDKQVALHEGGRKITGQAYTNGLSCQGRLGCGHCDQAQELALCDKWLFGKVLREAYVTVLAHDLICRSPDTEDTVHS